VTFYLFDKNIFIFLDVVFLDNLEMLLI